MKLPKFLSNFFENSENYQEKFNKEVQTTVNQVIESAKKDLANEAVKAAEQRLSASRRFVTTSGTTDFNANLYSAGKNYDTLSIMYSDAPGSVQSGSRIRDSVLGGGYVIKPAFEGKGKKSDLNRLIKFFDMPNPEDTIETLVGVAIENYLAYGNFYWEKVPTKGSAKSKHPIVAELYNIDPTRMTILVDSEKKQKGVLEKIGYKQSTEANRAIIYDKNEIFHVRRPNRKADLYGRAVLEDNMSTIQLLLRALTYNINILKNGGRTSMQLILPEDSTEADADSVSSYYEKNYMGAHNAGKTMVLFKGAKAEAVGVSPADIAYLELFKYGIQLIGGQYGVPLLLIGFPEGANRASAAELRRSFYLTNVFPIRKLISQKITKEIIQDGMGIEGWRFDFKTAGLEESEASRRDFMLGQKSGLYSFNEARLACGQLPIDEDWASKYYLVSSKNDSMIEVEKAIVETPGMSEGPKNNPNPDAKKPGTGRGQGDQDPTADAAQAKG